MRDGRFPTAPSSVAERGQSAKCQSVTVTPFGQNPLAEVAIGRLKKSDPLLLTVVLPVNVAFPNSPSFSPDAKDSDPLDLGWRKCLPGGCFADVVLKDDVLQRWKTQSGNGRLIWKDAAGRDFAIGVSSSGLAQALDAFSKEP